MEKKKMRCDECRCHLTDEDLMQHQGMKLCPECMAKHIRKEHFTAAVRRVWTYRAT